MGDNLKQKMLTALTWTTIDRFGQQIVQFIIGLVLARLLTPDDYGLIGMVMVFVALSNTLVDGGFGQALIRKEKPDQKDYSTIFFLNFGISIIIYVVLFVLAPSISGFFNQPQLTIISRVLFLAVILFSLYFVQYVIIIKELAYKTLAKVNITTTIISGSIGIYLAFKGYGVWALVVQQISFHIFRLVFFYTFRKWKPTMVFSFSVVKEFWTFSIHLLGIATINVLFNNIYLIIIGKFYPLKQIGYYSQANKLNDTVSYSFQQIIQGATYPLLVRIQHDEERFRRVYRKMIHMITVFVFPLLFTLIVVAVPFISILLSKKWLMSIPYFQLLCLANIFTPLYGLNTSALNSRGESKRTLNIELIKKGLIILSILICFSLGIKAMLMGFIVANTFSFILSMIYIKNNLKYSFKLQLHDFLPSLLISIIVSLFIWSISSLIGNSSHLTLLATQLSLAFIIYLILFVVFEKELFRKIKAYVFLKYLKL